MKVIVVPLTAVVLVLTGVFVGCKVPDKPSLTEDEVLNILCDDLAAKADTLQSWGVLEKLLIEFAFWDSISAAGKDAPLPKELNASELQLVSLPAFACNQAKLPQYKLPKYMVAAGIKKVATYTGNSWWVVSVKGTWRINELTKEVQPADDVATKALDEVTLKTYTNPAWGYEIAYPPSWKVEYDRGDAVLLSAPNQKASVLIAVTPVVPPLLQDLQTYIESKRLFLAAWYSDFTLTQRTPTSLYYNFRETKGGKQLEARHCFVKHQDRVYEIVSGAYVDTLGLGSGLYDACPSFRLPLSP